MEAWIVCGGNEKRGKKLARLYKEGLVVFTGCNGEAKTLADAAHQAGFNGHFVLEKQAHSTLGNIYYSTQLIKSAKKVHIIVGKRQSSYARIPAQYFLKAKELKLYPDNNGFTWEKLAYWKAIMLVKCHISPAFLDRMLAKLRRLR